jgi:transcriptional regulator with XRE-family HTH domain
MGKMSSGIKSLDGLIDSIYIGDNVVWEVDAGTSYEVFIHNFIRQSFNDSQKVFCVSFNKSPQSILNELNKLLYPKYFTLVDCFTSGKGKNDNTFLRFYENPPDINVIRIKNPRSIEEFTQKLNSIEDSFSPGVRYVFDSLTGMQDLWGNESDTYKFFTYMCPRLYDLGTVAYWLLEKDAHSQGFKANLRHITQVVFDIYKRRDKLYIKALKLEGRQDREAFKPHLYEIDGRDVTVTFPKRELASDVGGRIKDVRTRLGINQKELADKVDLTPSFISQLENNQISPSLSSFLQIAEALGISPTALLQKEKKRDEADWLFRKDHTLQSLLKKEEEYSLFNIVSNDKTSAYLTVINAGAELDGHFLSSKKNELIYVLKGTVSVKIENSEKMLSPGDSIYLKHSIPSVWKNALDEETELLVICV